MAIGFIIAILLLGFILIFLELFFIPGTYLVGILGALAVLVGVVLMYVYYGSGPGNIALGASAVGVVLSVAAGFKVIQSNRLAMKAEIKGRVNELEENTYAIGDQGAAITELRPNGKAIFNGNKTEVYSYGEYITRNSPVQIVKISEGKIFVKPIK